ncbi:hypothetical protein C7H84_18980 [Burkholderia sp. Nafp2/4-1b]|uniref:hypothetical protein n=1 Tax=Burkholderia sp. Nafp2/4-1b TaxID=2116686 RepID=UPI000EF907D8|nr:hypothetical protein [Burkholderia sp. Nafp2/4-1b]RKU01956.1 hypothetical protein C7H84_18980 [Burkholderia sp. Nafp2/4-1b]
MSNTFTIRYELLTDTGLHTVVGEPVSVPNEVGAVFGLHAESALPDGHPDKWIVTHLASGVPAGTGASRILAIAHANRNLDQHRWRLRAMLDDAITARTELQVAMCQLAANQLAVFPPSGEQVR